MASVPLSFDDYFTFERIVKMLARWRVRVISRRRDAEFYAVHFKGERQPADKIRCPLSEYLPPRNKWTRPKRAEREELGAGAAIFERMIVRTVMGYRRRGAHLEAPGGGRSCRRLLKRCRRAFGMVDLD